MSHPMTETQTLCVSCHFDDEEELVLPHLPWWQRIFLREGHRQLRARGYPPDAVLRHAHWEMKVFRKYCPPDVVAAVDAQHARLIPMLGAQLV